MYRNVKQILRKQAGSFAPAYSAERFAPYLSANARRAGIYGSTNGKPVAKKVIPVLVGLLLLAIFAAVVSPVLRGSRPPVIDVTQFDDTVPALGAENIAAPTQSALNVGLPETTENSVNIPPTEPLRTTVFEGSGLAVGSSVPSTTQAIAQEPASFPAPTNTMPGETAYDFMVEKRWEERSLVSRFGEIEYGGKRYFFVSETPATQQTAEELTELTAEGYDNLTGTSHSVGVSVFSLSRMDPALVVGVCFEDCNGVWAYAAPDYIPATLSGMLEAIDFAHTVTIDGLLTEGDDQALPVDPDTVYSVLFADGELVPAGDGFDRRVASLIVSCPSLGIENKSVSLSAEGYIDTNLLCTYAGSCRFYVGRDTVERFLTACGISDAESLMSGPALDSSTAVQTSAGYSVPAE